MKALTTDIFGLSPPCNLARWLSHLVPTALPKAAFSVSVILDPKETTPPPVCTSFGQVDTFLRDNLDWMGRASNWAKFTATASIGVVHRGHMKESMNLLQPYLPQGGVSALPYSEGGALYALGLIHSNKGSDGNAQVCLEYCFGQRSSMRPPSFWRATQV